jgi:hypothetical protein
VVYVYAKLTVAALPILTGRLDFFAGRVDFRYSKSWLENPSPDNVKIKPLFFVGQD